MTTITLPRAVVEQALEALEWSWGGEPMGTLERDAITALRAALAQQAEPVQEQDAELSAALGWPGGISNPVLDRKVLLQKVAALAQQAEPVEPYCYVYEYDGVFGLHREFYPLPYNGMKPSRTVPVYTAPLQRKPLTDEEIDAIGKALLGAGYGGNTDREFTRAVERAHGIGRQTDPQIEDRLARHGIPKP